MSPQLSSSAWGEGERRHFLAQQTSTRSTAGFASGQQGAVTVAYSAYAARAGLEALKQGGSAVDAALTTALTQIALKAGAPISYFGIMSLVHFDARTGQISTMNAEWNTVRGETDPLSIPGTVSFGSEASMTGTEPSGRTALVGGFLKGVEAAHARFGRLPFQALFEPAIEVAETGTPIDGSLAWCYRLRAQDLARHPQTRQALLKPNGTGYLEGETLKQPELASTLRKVASDGVRHVYGGPWGERLVAAIQAEGGHMTLEDLTAYEVIWSDALVGDLDGGWSLATSPWPNAGGVALIEAQQLARASGLPDGPHWSQSAESLRTALDLTSLIGLSYIPIETAHALFPGIDMSPEARVTREHADALWRQLKNGNPLANWKRTAPMHSDDVVAVDSEGNMVAITHTINSVIWGKTALCVDGVTIGDPGSYQQALIASVPPGSRLPSPTETGILLKDATPVLAFASMGAGLHQRTFQCLLNITAFGHTVEQAINSPDFFAPMPDPDTMQPTVVVPAGRFDPAVLNDTGLQWREVEGEGARLAGEGIWVAIHRDPDTEELSAASHNRNNSAAVAH